MWMSESALARRLNGQPVGGKSASVTTSDVGGRLKSAVACKRELSVGRCSNDFVIDDTWTYTSALSFIKSRRVHSSWVCRGRGLWSVMVCCFRDRWKLRVGEHMLHSSKFDRSEGSWEKVLEGGCSGTVYERARIRYVPFSTCNYLHRRECGNNSEMFGNFLLQYLLIFNVMKQILRSRWRSAWKASRAYLILKAVKRFFFL